MQPQTEVNSGALDINEQFKKALDLLENTARSVFITGKAGTGKSTFLDYFRSVTRKQLAVLAPTGVAAVNIAGQTIHSFFRFQPNITSREAERIAKQSGAESLFGRLQMIVIDEISMVRADLLDCVDVFLRTIRGERAPFGGLQMVFIGDLYQLPPVVTSREREVFTEHYRSPYFFDAQVMHRLFSQENRMPLEFIELEKIYRQQDNDFIALLNAIRNKTVTDQQIAKLNDRYLESGENPEGYIHLTSMNQQADELNRRYLERLPGKPRRFVGAIQGEFAEKDAPAEVKLYLKKNARVMLLNNDSRGRWINGTLGTAVKVTRSGVSVKIDQGDVVEIEPHTWNVYRSKYNRTSKEIETEPIGSFTQFPLRLAWAITIHKSQGKTFDRVIVDVGRGTFAHGQTYVALSRCRSWEGMLLKTPLKKGHIQMDFRVVNFLTRFQYHLSKLANPLEDKIEVIKSAIEKKQKLQITYLKARDEKSKRTILPVRIEEMEFEGRRFLGLEAYCFTRQDTRVFNAERILEISQA